MLWVSQARGLLLSLYVLAVLWPALLLYNIVDRAGGSAPSPPGWNGTIGDRGLLLVLLAWAFSALLEGLAGFGLPIAVVSPMLVALGVAPGHLGGSGGGRARLVGDLWRYGRHLPDPDGVVKLEPASLAPIRADARRGLPAVRVRRGAHPGAGTAVAARARPGTADGRRAVRAGSGRLTPLAALGAGLAGILGGILLGGGKAVEPQPEKTGFSPAADRRAGQLRRPDPADDRHCLAWSAARAALSHALADAVS